MADTELIVHNGRVFRSGRPGSRLPLRVRMALDMPPGGIGFVERLDEFEALWAEEPDTARLRTGILKSFLDGVVEARTAYLLEPYPGTDARG